jgi:hypothetical protein
MRYFRLVTTYTLPNGNFNTLSIVQKCEDIDYTSETENAILNARVTSKRMCGGIEPNETSTLTELTLAQYNTLVPSSTAVDLGDPTELQNELGE